MRDPKVDACVYLLQGILQKLDDQSPGLVDEMICRVKGDRAAIPESIHVSDHVSSIFDETLKILTFLQQMNIEKVSHGENEACSE